MKSARPASGASSTEPESVMISACTPLSREARGRRARVLRRDARHVEIAARAGVRGDDHLAPADPEIERHEQVGLALAQDVAPAHAEVGRAVLDVRRYVVWLEQEEAQGAPASRIERTIVGASALASMPARASSGTSAFDACAPSSSATTSIVNRPRP